MRILLCVGIMRGSTRKTVNLHVELVSDAAPVPSVAVAVPADFPGAEDMAAPLLRSVAAAVPATTQFNVGLETQGFIYEQPTEAYGKPLCEPCRMGFPLTPPSLCWRVTAPCQPSNIC
jgi:hypothetical protein